jgi:hypothetical protein
VVEVTLVAVAGDAEVVRELQRKAVVLEVHRAMLLLEHQIQVAAVVAQGQMAVKAVLA